MLKKLLWAALALTGLLIVFVLATITTTYQSSLEDSAQYQQTLQRANAVNKMPNGDTVRVGWAQVSLEPPYPTPIAIDAHRDGVYEQVLDSVFAKAIVFDNGVTKAAMVTVDLLIFPPSVTAVLNDSLAGTGFGLQNVYLSATHTHSSIGAWAPGYVGEIFGGTYDTAIVAHIAHCAAQSIRNANDNLVKAQIGFNKVNAHELVYNRLLKDSINTDPWLRYIRITRDDGQNAIIASFAAHATFLHDSLMKIHPDYPGVLAQQLEALPNIHFAAFVAGAMGSMGPAHEDKGPWAGMEQLASDLMVKVAESWDNTPMDYIQQINTVYLPIDMPE
jgi:hypothetical protein